MRAHTTLVAAFACFATTVLAAPFADRRVSDVLDELRGEGLVFIYSTSTVPAQLRVLSEPGAASGVALAREILAAHGLSLREAAPKIYSVVRDPAAKPSATPAPGLTQPPVEQVVVQTSRYMLHSDFGASRTFLSQEQLKDLPQLADEALRAVQRLPGSATNGFSSVGPVRGGLPGEMAIILDGLRLYEPFHLKNFMSPVSLLDSRLIEGIEFHSGGFPVIYGDRMSAIIDARSIRPGRPRYFEVGLDLFHFSALGSTAFANERGQALLSYRRSNLGELEQFSEKDYGEPDYEDAFGRFDYALGERTDAALEFLVSRDEITAKQASATQQVTAGYRNAYVWGTLEHAWSEAADSRVIVSYTDLNNRRRGRIDEPLRTAVVTDDRSFRVIGLRWDNSFESATLQHRVGVEGRRLWGRYDYASDIDWSQGAPFVGSPAMHSRRRLTPEPEGYETLAYWDVRADFDDRWTFQGGMRVDTQTYDGSGDGEQWSPRFGVLYALSAGSRLRASWGRFYQSQGINELQVEDGIDRFHPAEFADHFIVGFDHAFESGFDLRVEAYRKRYRRLSPRFENMFDPLVLFPEAEYDRVMIDPSSARAYGIETLLRLKQWGSWSGWLGYTWSQVQDRIDGRDVPRGWDQRHAINLAVVWSKGPWTVSVANSYHSGWPTTALAFDQSATPRVATGERNRARLSAFNSLDFRITRVFALSHGVLDVFVEATNATARSNICCIEYESVTDASGGVTYRSNTDTWLPIIPSAGFLWRY